MFNIQHLHDLSSKIKELSLKSPADDLKNNIYALLQGTLTKLELVSREEFDVQADLLRLTRQKLDLLQKRLDALENGHTKAE